MQQALVITCYVLGVRQYQFCIRDRPHSKWLHPFYRSVTVYTLSGYLIEYYIIHNQQSGRETD